MLKINGTRLWDSLMEMAKIGATPEGGVSRVAVSEEDRLGRDLLRSWATPLVEDYHFDEVGNMFFVRHGLQPGSPMILTGSHLDTQIHGGRFDGAFGVMAGLEVLRTLAEEDVRLPYGIGLVAWTNEEEARYCPAMGSAVFVGKQDLQSALDCVGLNGKVFGEELKKIGYLGSPLDLNISAYLEAHIEQGPVLENEEIQIGVVSGAQGQIAMNAEIIGEAGHSGTVPMRLRKDALVCAIDVINSCRELVVEEGKGVFTVGAFKLEPNSRTTIPDKISFGIDLRHPDADSLQNLQNLINKKIKERAAEHCCQERIEVLFHKEPVVFTDSCVESVQSASDQLKYSSLVMPSGAFHDACLLASQVPTGMIFVPSQKGVSHNPTEYSSPEQLEKGANVLLHALLNLAEKGVPLS